MDQLLGAAEVVCTHDQNGDSCGVKLLEFALIENELLDSENESTFCQEVRKREEKENTWGGGIDGRTTARVLRASFLWATVV